MSVEHPPSVERNTANESESGSEPATDGVCAERKTAAFDRLVGPLFRYAQRLLRRADLAEDAVQEAFLRLWQTPQPPSDGQLSAWLFRVCRNWSLDLLRKDGRMSTLASDELHTPVATDSPTAALDKRDQLTQLRHWIAALPEQQQELLRLRFDGELSYAQIAEVTGLSVSHVGVVLHQALSRLRERARGNDPESVLEE